MKKIFCLVAVFMTLLSGFPAVYAEDDDIDTPVDVDHRIRTFVYNENEVFELVTEYGYQSSVEFSEGEQIYTISIGDSTPFKITPAGNRMFIKALQNDRFTNMTVITNYHTYQFDLSSIVKNDEGLIYVMRFYYPEKYDNDRGEIDIE